MKAITVRQPWAHLIVHGPKRVENRKWKTDCRGPLLIHAGASRACLGQGGEYEPPEEGLVFGVLLGTVRLVDCVRLEEVRGSLFKPAWVDGPFTEGPWCWLLEDPKPLPIPIPYRGRQLLFDVPDEFVRDPAGYLLHAQN